MGTVLSIATGIFNVYTSVLFQRGDLAKRLVGVERGGLAKRLLARSHPKKTQSQRLCLNTYVLLYPPNLIGKSEVPAHQDSKSGLQKISFGTKESFGKRVAKMHFGYSA